MTRIGIFVVLAATFMIGGCESSSGDSAEFERGLCQDACDGANFGGANCYDAPTLAACRDGCLRRSAADAESFDSCASGARGSGVSFEPDADCPAFVQCLDILGVEPSSGTNNANNETNASNDPIASCKTNCDHIASECGDSSASTTAECKLACDGSPTDTLDSFDACVQANYYSCTSGDLQACYDHLGVLP